MALSTSQMFIILIVGFIVYSIYKTWKLKDYIYCTFIRQDRTEINKYAKISQGKIEFDNGFYNLDVKRTTLKLVWNGIIPTWVRCLKFKFDSNKPIDPTTWNNTYDKPEDRKALNRTEAIQSLMTKQNTILSAKAGKKSMLEGLMPVILIGGLLILGYMVYQQQAKTDMLGMSINVLQEQNIKLQKSIELIK